MNDREWQNATPARKVYSPPAILRELVLETQAGSIGDDPGGPGGGSGSVWDVVPIEGNQP